MSGAAAWWIVGIVGLVAPVLVTINAAKFSGTEWSRAGFHPVTRILFLASIPLYFVCCLGLLMSPSYLVYARPRLMRARRGETLRPVGSFDPGKGKLGQLHDRVDREIVGNVADGRREFVVMVSERELPWGAKSLSVVAESLVSQIQTSPGLTVKNVTISENSSPPALYLAIAVQDSARAVVPEMTPFEDDQTRARRGQLLLEAEPPVGTEGLIMSPELISATADWMKGAVAGGYLRAVWERRLAIGYHLDLRTCSQPVTFWISAAPAIAGLRLTLRDHPLVGYCVDQALRSTDYQRDDQTEAQGEINGAFYT